MEFHVEVDMFCQGLLPEPNSEVTKIIVRCTCTKGPITLRGYNNTSLIVFESERSSALRVVDMPALRRMSLAGVHELDFGDRQHLESLELRRLKKGKALNLQIPSVEALTIQDGSLPICVFEQPLALRRLSFGHIKDPVPSRWAGVLRNIEVLHIFQCGTVDHTLLGGFPLLKRLILIDAGRIPSVEFLKQYPELKALNLGGSTYVESGDLAPIVELKHLEFLLFVNRRHYNYKVTEYSGDPKCFVAK